ncbi:protein kinase [Verrucomicrobiaceae bacterium N1E253]|uniref:Protein kinase n=1 Tax=Oceaniferula marina TaxID=2748318 RepID=A0A851GJN4_9BACT|nr:protein kinase [Oceaniferula marina]NWK54900.1 protein kinase [Oceaniferula marina]
MTPYPESTCPTTEELSDLLSGYEVHELISLNQHGALYRANQVSLDRAVTIKVLPPEIAQAPDLRQAFETGAKSMAKLKHPNLVDVFDFGISGNMLYIIMEHIPGRTLHETTHGNYVKEHEALTLVLAICRGLSLAHREGIVHGRLHPSNILLDNDGHPKIVNFGFSNLDEGELDESLAAYLAPELASADTEASTSSDVYSLGIMLYTLLTGVFPQNPYQPPSSIQSLSPDIDNIVALAIQPDPLQRYNSVSDMADALETILEKTTTPRTPQIIAAAPVSRQPGLGGPQLRASTLSSANSSSSSAPLIIILVVVVVIAIIAIAVNSSSSPEKENTPDPQPNAQPDFLDRSSPSAEKRNKQDQKTSELGEDWHKPVKNRDADTSPDEGTTSAETDISPDSDATPDIPDPLEDEKAKDQLADKESDSPESEDSAQEDPEDQPAPPEFDIEAYLVKARTFMQGQAKRTLSNYDEDLSKNIDSFERDVKRVLRKLERNIRKPMEIKSTAAFAEFRQLGRIPETIDLTDIKELKAINPIHKEALANQTKIDNKYLIDFTKSRITYFQGIDKQIAALRKEGNDAYAEMLEAEIDVTQKSMERYIRILRGLDPDPPEEEVDEEEDGKKKKKKKKQEED